jgi:ACT domain-containing protein
MRGFILECEKGILTDIVTLAENNKISLKRIEKTTSEDDFINIKLYINDECNIFNIDSFIKDVNKIREVNSVNIIY